MPPVNNQTPKKPRPKLYLGGGLLVVLILIVLGVWLVRSGGSSPGAPAQSPKISNGLSYTYSKLDSYQVSGYASGQGMTFLKPMELIPVNSRKYQAELAHSINQNAQPELVSYIMAQSVSGVVLNAGSSQSFNNQIMSSSSRQPLIQSLDGFLKSELPAKTWKYSLGPTTAFKNSTVNADAWSFSVTMSEQKSGKSLNGQLIYIITSSRNYYFLILAKPNVWQSNQAVWQKVTDSIKVDQ
ncbi:MAG TPA: hypothetical protein VFP35_01420 [Candidatus Saccharimonadales bacterium]|nr:hypothetical protein [Candidatus Saccharimonadales bacterium]